MKIATQPIHVSKIEDSSDLNTALDHMISGTPDLFYSSTHQSSEDVYKRIISDSHDMVHIVLGLSGMSGQECISI